MKYGTNTETKIPSLRTKRSNPETCIPRVNGDLFALKIAAFAGKTDSVGLAHSVPCDDDVTYQRTKGNLLKNQSATPPPMLTNTSELKKCSRCLPLDVVRGMDYLNVMRKLVLFIIFLIAGAPAMAQGTMKLTSNDITDGGTLPMDQVYGGCGGQNISPQLSWSGAPAGTKSFAVTVYDPDAPTGSGWWHWQVFNIPADVSELARGASMKAMPAGAVENFSDYDEQGFGGACPPKGDAPHRYIFTVFALDVEHLPLSEKDSAAKVGFHLNAHTIEKAQITATYGH